jgi:hypothetical protein
MFVYFGVSTKDWRRSKLIESDGNVRLLGTGHGRCFFAFLGGRSNDSVSEFVTTRSFRVAVSHDTVNQTITFSGHISYDDLVRHETYLELVPRFQRRNQAHRIPTVQSLVEERRVCPLTNILRRAKIRNNPNTVIMSGRGKGGKGVSSRRPCLQACPSHTPTVPLHQ